MRIGILTSGGDCPGLNAVIRGAVLKGTQIHKQEFLGFRDGWRGVVDGDVMPLSRREIQGIGKQGGTILGTSRTNPFDGDGGVERITANLDRLGIDAIIAIGGEGTLAAAKRLTDAGLKIVGVPKTVDNDLGATDYTFGFDTAVQIATDAMDRLRTTGDSHSRCMIAEVMGRHVGWIALHSGMAAGAHAILIPEKKTSMDEIVGWVQAAYNRGRAPLVVVAEGFVPDSAADAHNERGLDAFGRPRLGGIGEQLAPIIEERTGIETRATTLGHIQRGGTPTSYDRVLATRLGLAAVDSVMAGHWGRMVALRGTDIVHVDFAEALKTLKTVPQDRYDEAAILFG
ncbi:6-phosphofructokinase [Planctomonas psychrotolerans]|uniref:6-phosphofructokinase n=1 Tax=Planctomonas psychrotolerans TaxID=2528712 RepID=UPI0012395F5F|nr:6-phosphofructokinase [Planctomonas psychrotolerans]